MPVKTGSGPPPVPRLWTTRGSEAAVHNLTTDLGDDVFSIDTQMSGYSGITSAYLIRGDRPCLVETGTATSAPVVAQALAALGVGPEDLASVVVTHIHLDHAGGVGTLAQRFPAAEVVVHERGARHLVDPERLMTSARRVFGRVLDDVFGVLLPTEASRVRALGDVGEIDLGGGRRLSAFHAPGHAQHHVGLVDSASGDLYVGDAAGVYIPETADMRPSTPPPDFDLDLALASLARFREVGPQRLLFSHFGPVLDVDGSLGRAEEELRLWVELVRESRASALDLDHAVQRVTEKTAERYAAYLGSAEVSEKFEHLNATAANIVGINRWLDSVDGAGSDLGDPSASR
jgi:glyoxylase-like metal-dependent hydrolase (beta-lactamase superfamily II)